MSNGCGSQSIVKLVGTWIITGTLMLYSMACSGTPSRASTESLNSATLTIGFPLLTVEDPLHGVRQAARLASLEGLTTQSLNGRAIPRLAEGWEVSADGLTWTIRLRTTALFHDGSAVDAAAVKRSLERYLAAGATRLTPGLQDIVSIDTSGPYLLTIRLRQRSSLLLDDLEAPITKVDAGGSAIATGPYVLSPASSDEIVMTAFPKYYRGISRIDKLVWRPYPTVRTAWAAAMRGDVDFLYEVGPETREFLESEASVELYTFLRAYVYGVVFNARRPLFRDPEVRKALNYAVDRANIVAQAFRGHATVASGPAWPLHWAYDKSAPQYLYDPGRAAASLGKALKSHRGIGPATNVLKFVCLIPENVQLWERLALIVQRDLAEIGVDMGLEAVPVDVFNQRIATGDFDVLLMEMVSGTSVNRPFSFWHSKGIHSLSGYANSSVDAALENIRRALDDNDYKQGFHQFQQATFDDPPAIFLAWGETARAVSRRFDVVRAPGGDIRMSISDWKLASEAAN